jgi:hypothetical protein
MQDPKAELRREALLLRVLWMLVFVIVWQVAELVLLCLVVAQLLVRLVQGEPNGALMDFGDRLSRYLAQIGRFASFHSDRKPWPFADWPAARDPERDIDPVPPAPVDTPPRA